MWLFSGSCRISMVTLTHHHRSRSRCAYHVIVPVWGNIHTASTGGTTNTWPIWIMRTHTLTPAHDGHNQKKAISIWYRACAPQRWHVYVDPTPQHRRLFASAKCFRHILQHMAISYNNNGFMFVVFKLRRMFSIHTSCHTAIQRFLYIDSSVGCCIMYVRVMDGTETGMEWPQHVFVLLYYVHIMSCITGVTETGITGKTAYLSLTDYRLFVDTIVPIIAPIYPYEKRSIINYS